MAKTTNKRTSSQSVPVVTDHQISSAIDRKVRRLFSRSKRQALVYFVLGVFVVFNAVIIAATIFGRIQSEHTAPILGAFNLGFGALSALSFGYIWGETKRPHHEPTSVLQTIKEGLKL